MNFRLIICSVLHSFLLAMAQVSLKLALSKTVGKHYSSIWSFFKMEYSNYWFYICGLLFISTTLFWMWILREFPMSQVYPMSCIAYVFGFVAAVIIFHDVVTFPKLLGLAMIVVGAMLLSLK